MHWLKYTLPSQTRTSPSKCNSNITCSKNQINYMASEDTACIAKESRIALLWFFCTGFPESAKSCWFGLSIYF